MPASASPAGSNAESTLDTELAQLAAALMEGAPILLHIKVFVGAFRAHDRQSLFVPRPFVPQDASGKAGSTHFLARATVLRTSVLRSVEETQTFYSDKMESVSCSFDLDWQAQRTLPAELCVSLTLFEGCGVHFPRQACDAVETALKRHTQGLVIDRPYWATQEECKNLADKAALSFRESIDLAHVLALGSATIAQPGEESTTMAFRGICESETPAQKGAGNPSRRRL